MSDNSSPAKNTADPDPKVLNESEISDTSDNKAVEPSKNMENKDQNSEKESSIASRLQLLEKRFKGPSEAKSQCETDVLKDSLTEQMDILEAFNLPKEAIAGALKNSKTFSDEKDTSQPSVSSPSAMEVDDAKDVGDNEVLDDEGSSENVKEDENCADKTTVDEAELLSGEGKESKEAEVLKKGKGIDAIAKMLRTQHIKSEDPKVDNESTVNGEEAPNKEPGSNPQNDDNVVQNDKVPADDKPDESSAKNGDDDKSAKSQDQNDSGSVDQSTRSRKKRLKTCQECERMKVCKYQLMMQGATKMIRTQLCDDICYAAFRLKQKQKSAQKKKPAGSDEVKARCLMCHKNVAASSPGYVSTAWDNKLVLCSESCYKNFKEMDAPKHKCVQCSNMISEREKCLMWETMEFCSEDCLSGYQTHLGSHCACCNNPVQDSSLGKFSVRFGSDIKQFCSNTCLEEFKKGLKVCSFCQKDISNGADSFLAPVGDKGQFKDFCAQQCMEKYDTMNKPKSATQSNLCCCCNEEKSSTMEVVYKTRKYVLCNEQCFLSFKYSHHIKDFHCHHCYKLFEASNASPKLLNVQVNGFGERFCSEICLNIFVLSNRKIVPCSWCKVKKYNFDMIERYESSTSQQLFCSLHCLSLHRTSTSTSSSSNAVCDFCKKDTTTQYHLTMSDNSIRNFCSYSCVTKFQNQYPKLNGQKSATPIISKQSVTKSNQSTPVISNVVSLKPKSISRQNNLTNNFPKTPTSGNKTAQTITQQVIIKPPAPKAVQNKGTMCRPIDSPKTLSNSSDACHKSTQTDSSGEPIKYVPIPVPVYIPLPMHMYSMPTPVLIPFPVPVPVPIFIPTLKNSTEDILKCIKEIKEKMPHDPFEADLLMMAEMVADNNKIKEISYVANSDSVEATEVLPSSDPEKVDDLNSNKEELAQLYDLEILLENAANSPSSTEPKEEVVDEEGEEIDADQQKNNLGNKRKLDDDNEDKDDGSSSKKPRIEAPSLRSYRNPNNKKYTESVKIATTLLNKFGVEAWKNWVIKKNKQLEQASRNNRKLKLFKTDILQLSADELNYSLCLFIKEIRNPAGEPYSSDAIYYLCLGIQQYLFLNNRVDNIFTDTNFEKFTECLNEILMNYENFLLANNKFVPRLNDEILWKSRQLGAHSPHVLLNTLLYFNTKFFGLKTIDDHMLMSFSLVVKHWKKVGTSNITCLKYYSPAPIQQPRGPKRKKEYLEQLENDTNPLRCPVKLYEFYLLKCPESIKSRSDVYYLHPERSCVPDSPVWYSTQALGREPLCKMLQRTRMIKGVF